MGISYTSHGDPLCMFFSHISWGSPMHHLGIAYTSHRYIMHITGDPLHITWDPLCITWDPLHIT